ncbi:unnamed protein product [Urochloa humidicola]
MNGPINKADAAAMSSSHAGDAITGDMVCGGAAGGGGLAELPLHLTEKILYHISLLASCDGAPRHGLQTLGGDRLGAVVVGI